MLKLEEKNVMHAKEKDGMELIGLSKNLAKKDYYVILVIIVMAEALNQLKTIGGFVQDVKGNLK